MTPRPTRPPVLLHAVAAVVELGEGRSQFIQEVTERVQQQVVQDLLQDLREPQDALPQLPLLLVVQDHLCRLCRFAERNFVNVGQTSYGSEEETGRKDSTLTKNNRRQQKTMRVPLFL